MRYLSLRCFLNSDILSFAKESSIESSLWLHHKEEVFPKTQAELQSMFGPHTSEWLLKQSIKRVKIKLFYTIARTSASFTTGNLLSWVCFWFSVVDPRSHSCVMAPLLFVRHFRQHFWIQRIGLHFLYRSISCARIAKPINNNSTPGIKYNPVATFLPSYKIAARTINSNATSRT